MNSSKQQKIDYLKEKIRELGELYSEDIGMSLREAVQTEEMLTVYKKQLIHLETSSNTILKTFRLKNNTTELTIHIVDKNPDPKSGIISIESPIAIKLIKLKIGEVINIGKNEFEILNIS